MDETVVQTDNLSKSFAQVRALSEVTLAVNKGVTTGLVGPNGAGKTTLFSLLCGFLKPSSGFIKVLGYPPNHPALRNRAAILPQDAAFLRSVAIGRQLTMLAELQGFSRRDARIEAQRVLELVQLTTASGHIPDQLSHGMLKRVSIAQAFIGAPELVLLDEPTSGLDPETANHIRTLIRQLSGERTFIISSHNLAVIEDLCGEILILDKGKLAHHSKIADLIARTRALSFRLESDPPDDVEKLFSHLPRITQVDSGQPGQCRLVVHFSDSEDQQLEIEILKCLAKGGLAYREMVRGERLEEKVADMTASKPQADTH